MGGVWNNDIILADVRVFFKYYNYGKSGICTISCHGNTVGVALVWFNYQLEELTNKGGQKNKITIACIMVTL